MIKIYDCSNSSERPEHRGNGGPVENDVIRYLKENAETYECEFTDNPQHSDILVTNDVFPQEFRTWPIAKLKRMDGIYFQEQYRERNIPLNAAAQQADHVIFISEFSKESYENLYGVPLKSCSVALNQVDPKVFFPRPYRYMDGQLNFVTMANDWSRPEKRLDAILDLADIMDSGARMTIIGRMPKNVRLPQNVDLIDYIKKPVNVRHFLHNHQAFVNFSYRDAAPKTVAQALSCGLPVLYANSGGVFEQVGWQHGHSIYDGRYEESFIPSIDKMTIGIGYENFKLKFRHLSTSVLLRNNNRLFKQMLDHYFGHIRRLVNERKCNT